MKIYGTKILAVIVTLMFVLSASIAAMPFAIAQVPNRKDAAYLSVNPTLVGVGQDMTVNLWIYPAATTLHFGYVGESFSDITITFMRPDGSKDTFMPIDGSGGLKAGETELIGAIWFIYKPNQVGTWTAQFSYPGGTIGTGSEAVKYDPATSEVVTFTVQSQPVQIGLPPASLPTGYWERPINADNREWAQISSDWPQAAYDQGTISGSRFNPYSKAPNSAHIIWKNQVSSGGLIGGPWGSFSYADAGGTPPIIMMGNIYYNMPGGVFRCIDLRSGQLKYEKPGNILFGTHLRASSLAVTFSETGTPIDVAQYEANAPVPYLFECGATQWKIYDALTGTLLRTISNAPGLLYFGPYMFEGDSVAYVIQQSGWNTTVPNRLAQNNLIKWDLNKVTGNNWPTGIIWNTSMKQPDGSGPGEGQRVSGLLISGDVGSVITTGEDMVYGFDLNTGKKLFTKKTDYLMMGAIYLWDSAVGVHPDFDSVTRRYHGMDIKTGNDLWVSEPLSYPWGSNPLVRGVAYGNFYIDVYDGYLYAMDTRTGKINWKFYCGSTTETPFGNWVPYASNAHADGKAYVATSEHTPTQPRLRGNKLFCVNAYTGEKVWDIFGAIGSLAIADGYLIGTGENDGLMYCFGKGKTAVTVTAPQTVVPKGTGVLIQGTVMDQSLAQPNTPALSDASMSGWMSYMHMQKEMPTNIQGVPVTLTATAPDGSNINIGETTSDGYGYYQFSWTAPNTGNYKIQATFMGSESYWSSTAQTGLAVTAASASPSVSVSASPSGTTAPPPGNETGSMTLYIAIAAVVIIAAIVAIALVLRRRK